MKDKIIIDIGKIMDEVFDAAQDFGEAFKHEFHTKQKPPFEWDESVDFYPTYSYPPTNVYLKSDKTLVLEFALAGFKEDHIHLEFSGDYMLFSAKVSEEHTIPEDVKFFKHRLKLKDISQQRYYVPVDKFDQEQVKAIFKNGILTVTIPPKEDVTAEEGTKIHIMKEGE